jgi:hypothetical protein
MMVGTFVVAGAGVGDNSGAWAQSGAVASAKASDDTAIFLYVVKLIFIELQNGFDESLTAPTQPAPEAQWPGVSGLSFTLLR